MTHRRWIPASLCAVAAVLLATVHLSPAGATPSVARSPTAPTQAASTALSLGDTGPSVAAWQRELNILAGAGISVDGAFGRPTEQWTISFQRFFGLQVTGTVDSSTRDVMAILIAVTEDDFTELVRYDEFQVAGFTQVGAFCFDVRDDPAFSLECSDVSSGQPISSQVIAVGHPGAGASEPVMVGTIEPTIDRVQVDLAGGGSVDADITRDVAGGIERDLWVSPARADEIAVVRALAVDGSEVRRIVVEDDDDFLVLEYGDRGPAVATWQLQLNTATGVGIAEDGVFGTSTVEATTNFQAFFGLRVDGIVGPNTRETMLDVLEVQRDQPEGDSSPVGDPISGDYTSPGFPSGPPTALLQDVRLGGHDGFDRVVFDFAELTPAVDISFIGPPISGTPSGEEVPVEGDAFLRVRMARASGLDNSGVEPVITYPGPDRLQFPDGSIVTEVVKVEDFEDQLVWVVGLDERAEYGVVGLDDP